MYPITYKRPEHFAMGRERLTGTGIVPGNPVSIILSALGKTLN